MTTIIKTVLFLLGMAVAAQWIAAFYGIIDLRYAIRRFYPRIIRDILIWSSIAVALVLFAGLQYRAAFLWGILVYILVYLMFFLLNKASIRRSMRLLDIR